METAQNPPEEATLLEAETSPKTNPPARKKTFSWGFAFLIVALLILGKCLLEGKETGNYLNAYFIALSAWIICAIQAGQIQSLRHKLEMLSKENASTKNPSP